MSSDGSQRDVIDFLSRPESYGLAAGSVDRYETHGALVFLAGDRAYKLKRAVHYPYMDYSTPERRRQMCERELQVNRRTAPQLYLEVRPIVLDTSGKLRFGTSGETAILDWVVVMRRFDQNNLLEGMRQKGHLSPAIIRLLAEAIAAFHRAAEPCQDFGGAEGIADVIAENTKVVESFMDRPFDARQVERFSQLNKTMLDRLSNTLQERRENGFVRRCHGDLHLNNICLIDERPVLFDAVEFSEAFACIDVFYDLAFPLMDLDRHRLRGHANILLNRYLEKTGDYDGIATLPLFLSCRAAIRAHVAAAASALSQQRVETQTRLGEAAALFDRAIAYLEPPGPRLVVVGGVSGTGKSTLARILAPMIGPAPGAVVIRSDVLRKRLMGVDESTRLPETAYQPEVTADVYREMMARAAKIVAGGHAVIVDAVYGDLREQVEIAAVAAHARVQFDGLWLEADPAILEARIAARRGDASDATIEVLRRQLGFVHRPERWLSIDAARTPAEIAGEVSRRLGLESPGPQ